MLLTGLVQPDRPSPGAAGQADVEPALRVAGAPDELGDADVPDPEVVAADRTGADGVLLRGLLHDLLADHLLVRLEFVKDPVKHPAGLGDDVFAGAFALLDELHMLFKRPGHLRLRDRRCMVVERIRDCPPDERRAERVPLHVAAGDEFADHLVPGALRPEAVLLHHLDEPALGVAGRRLRLLLFEVHAPDRQAFSRSKHREDLLLRLRVGVDPAPSRGEEPAASGSVGFAGGVEGAPDGCPRRVGGEGRKEPADNEFVDLPPVLSEGLPGCRARGMDRGMVRALLLAPRRDRPPVLLHPGDVSIKHSSPKRLQDPVQVQGLRVDRVVGPRVGDVPVHVEVFSKPHRICRRETQAARCDDECRGVERGRRPVVLLPLFHIRDHERLLCPCLCSKSRFVVGEPTGGVPRLHRLFVLLGHEREHPVGLGDEVLDLALPVHDHSKRRTLDPTY